MFAAKHLRRITSSGVFIPEIDGLRFVAISMVVSFHVWTFFMLIVCAAYFALCERPFMHRNWPARIIAHVRLRRTDRAAAIP